MRNFAAIAVAVRQKAVSHTLWSDRPQEYFAGATYQITVVSILGVTLRVETVLSIVLVYVESKLS